MPDIPYKENEWVQRFFRGKDEAVAAIAAKGTGKTYIAALWALREGCRIQPGKQGLITLNTLQQARDVYAQNIKPVMEELGIPHTFREQHMNLYIKNGTIIHLRSAEPDVVKRVESIEYAWWWGDECQDYAYESLKVFNSRVRKGLARKRITSMPADPDHHIYKFCEDIGATLYELSLYDNPDKEFAERYEKILDATYEGEQLRRYKMGERVSLTGKGLFYVRSDMYDELRYYHDRDLVLSWDFNVEYRAVTAWQLQYKNESGEVWGCIESHQMRESDVTEDAKALCEKYAGHASTVTLIGDASGDNRTAAVSHSMWQMVYKVFEKKFGGATRFRVPTSNPNVKDTIQVSNWALKSGLIKLDRVKSRHLYNSLLAVKGDRYGEPDKRIDTKDGPSTHEADTFRYFIWHALRRPWLNYYSNL